MSDPITIIDADYMIMVYYPDTKILHHTMRKPLHGQLLRDYLDKGTKAFHQYGATKWLSDDRKNTQIPQEDADWAMMDWAPRTIEAGWKYWAIIVPDEINARASMRGFMEDFFEKGVRINLFASVEDAKNWLASQN